MSHTMVVIDEYTDIKDPKYHLNHRIYYPVAC
jgi:hypothetical protein